MLDNDNIRRNFGFKSVEEKEHKNLVHDVFSSVATRYDMMNDIMSIGLHRIWKEEFVRSVPNLNSHILDVASGSGDIALRLLKRAKLQNKQLKITVCDINQDMLALAKDKAVDNNFLQELVYVCADAENLPFEDNSFDYYTISFGIRNVTNIEKALKEARRVLKPLGKFLCLEFSQVQNPCLKPLYNFYLFNIIPRLAEFAVSKKEDYEYLAQSISLFPDQETLKSMLYSAGFDNVQYKNLNSGIVTIHSAYKI